MGHYDNESGRYFKLDEVMNAHWLKNESDELFIVAKDSDNFETLGCDDSNAIEFLDQLSDAELLNPTHMAEAGFSIQPHFLKRFSEETGYYTA
jgi:hypothetical protein